MTGCSAKVFRPHSMLPSPCSRNAVMMYDGRGYCKLHFPPSVEARDKERAAKYNAEWEVKQKRWREERLGQRALDYMRNEHPDVVQQWEQEMK
jgi:hypothetical protein